MDYQALEKAVEEGIITENQINLSLSRLLKARFELGLMDEEVWYLGLRYHIRLLIVANIMKRHLKWHVNQ